ncbi:rna-directed dna polymerase from mobile element jockey-like [Pitangus sulphuratus]|nr:rna-directed dna polymerase from mobile element jockey-like [Pitangus sulphuratus]
MQLSQMDSRKKYTKLSQNPLSTLHDFDNCDDWKKRNIAPIIKKGNAEDLVIYRPVSLTSVPGKVMEWMLLETVYDGATTLVDGAEQLISPTWTYPKRLALCCMISYPVSKLERQGFDGWATRWIKDWLYRCTERVVVNSSLSLWRPVRSGVPQGWVLGPVLFNTFVSFMDSGIEGTLSKFTGNTKMCGAVETPEGRDTIQRDLVWVNIMKLNKVKWTVLPLGHSNPRYTNRLAEK